MNLLEKEKIFVPVEIKKLLEEREKARKNKNFKLADEIRERIKKAGYYIDDTDEGARLKKIK